MKAKKKAKPVSKACLKRGADELAEALEYLYNNSSAEVNDAARVLEKAAACYRRTPAGKRVIAALGRRLGG